LILLELGDKNAHAALLEQALDRFGKADNPLVANDIAWMSAVQPWKGDDVVQAVALAEKALKLSPNNPTYLTTLGATLYRAGRFDEAVLRLKEAQAAPFGDSSGPRILLFFAMAEHRLGHADQAKQWLQKAVKAIDQLPSSLSWDQRLELRLLREEAEAVLKMPSGAKGHP
jgi:tetratricopeptide (TPR) repeat protein